MNQKSELIYKLNNVLRADASRTVNKLNVLSPEERIERLKAIEEIKKYIDNYEENMKFIREMKEQNLRMEDDGR